jgi:hypothetical protein
MQPEGSTTGHPDEVLFWFYLVLKKILILLTIPMLL